MNIIVLKVLILGGTTFLGPHLVYELIERGHEVTLFNRGNQPCPFQDEVELLSGDRDGCLDPLKGRTFDAVIDTSGIIPRIVELSSKVLKENTSHYTYISTIGVYDQMNESPIDEDYPLAKLHDDTCEELDEKTSGALKAKCETIIQKYFPEKSLIIRPGVIVGPLDSNSLFSYCSADIIEYGNISLALDPDMEVQFIDVRDLSKWIVKMMEDKATGIYNATGPATPLTLKQFLQAYRTFSQKPQSPHGSKLPLCLSSKWGMPGFFKVSNHKAIQSGLTFTPLSKTIRDILVWEAHKNTSKIL